MPFIVVVDDLREFPFEAHYARSSAAALALLAELHASGQRIDLLLLDHDLGLTGDGAVDDVMPVVDWLCELHHGGQPLHVGHVVVHSDNPVGGSRVVRSLEGRYRTKRIRAAQLGGQVPWAPQSQYPVLPPE